MTICQGNVGGTDTYFARPLCPPRDGSAMQFPTLSKPNPKFVDQFDLANHDAPCGRGPPAAGDRQGATGTGGETQR